MIIETFCNLIYSQNYILMYEVNINDLWMLLKQSQVSIFHIVIFG
jgi:hypothetical protein